MGMTGGETLQHHGQLVETIHELSSYMRMLIMGKQGTTHAHDLIGSNIENVVIHSLANLIMVVQPSFQTSSHFPFTYDTSPIAKQVLKSSGIRVEAMLLQGDVVSVICLGYDFIVMGT
ncbi:hypothetical protein KAM342_43560 [Aeromonas caviae]|uniref:Uncharacterized protein n=2 Tax=Aeromonadaceae TaxID=84642 RepID=A0AAV4YSE2_AERCA|nr:hypothetical protein KAM341_43570 [Aeromonas caviae]GJA39113.1 hypothetical protein KAM342_43560 [Aeromonas caviae]GJA43630.1 hypothetical protein KAM343_44260 [Aeromonas caviae]GJA79360.1 hypothetical protein KAM354_45960 [Aeromonas caviae]GJA96506.1 hypothetical protein KAM358_43380 [Aeromonas caviae]